MAVIAQIVILAGRKISYISSGHLQMQIPLYPLITLRSRLHPCDVADVTSVKLEYRDVWWSEVLENFQSNSLKRLALAGSVGHNGFDRGSMMSPYLWKLFLHFLRHCRSTSHRWLNDGTHRAVRFHLSLQSSHSRRGIRERRVPNHVCDNFYSPMFVIGMRRKFEARARTTRIPFKGFRFNWLWNWKCEIHGTSDACKDAWKDRKNLFIPSISFEFINFRSKISIQVNNLICNIFVIIINYNFC